jgi:2'-5' RNA ligase
MAKERLGSPRARLFVALDLPEGVREDLSRWQKAEFGDPALRPVAPENLHVTLCFLGWQPEKRIPEIEAVLGAIKPAQVEMRLQPEAKPLPPRGQARLLVLDAPSTAAAALQAELSAKLQAQRLYEPERRDFRPHVTVARVRPERSRDPSGGRRRGRPMRIERLPGPLDDALREPFGAVRLTFYRSNLRSQGAEYVPLASLDLPPLPEGAKKE